MGWLNSGFEKWGGKWTEGGQEIKDEGMEGVYRA